MAEEGSSKTTSTCETPQSSEVSRPNEDKYSSPEAKKRVVFISCSQLGRDWKKVPKEVLKESLFFFGSKRRQNSSS